MAKTFKKGDWIIVHSKDVLILNGNHAEWSAKYERKIGQLTSEVFPGVYRTTIDKLALFECKDFKRFKGGI